MTSQGKNTKKKMLVHDACMHLSSTRRWIGVVKQFDDTEAAGSWCGMGGGAMIDTWSPPPPYICRELLALACLCLWMGGSILSKSKYSFCFEICILSNLKSFDYDTFVYI